MLIGLQESLLGQLSDQNGLQYTSEDWHEYAAEKTSMWVFTEGKQINGRCSFKAGFH